MNMSKVICGIAMSIDGFVAGNGLSEEKPFGDIAPEMLHRWMFDEPEKHQAEHDHLLSAGAYIMGRNMYGPPGESYDKTWKGWWGDEPPYHAPVYVLTHRAREPIPMAGGTTFHFVTEGIHAALEQARQVAGEKPVAIAGGAHTLNQYLAAGVVDELWLHVVPVTVGHGQRLFENVPNLRMEPLSVGGTALVTHIKYRILK
jgi:dihydrofolate reductase